MISDARGGHVSPGVYTEERDVTYSTKSLGITSLGLAGETVKGPAFQPIEIQDWTEFVDYFGGTSPEKFKGTGYPKYELPYIAESYLKESRNLNVVRILGLSGYEAGSAFTVTAQFGNNTADTMPVVVLRSKANYNATISGEANCGNRTQEKYNPFVTSIAISDYKGSEYGADCSVSPSGYTIPLSGTVSGLSDGTKIFQVEGGRQGGSFCLTINYNINGNSATTATTKYNVSLNPSDRDYIYNVFSTNPLEGTAPVYIEAVYDYAFNKKIQDSAIGTTIVLAYTASTNESNYKELYRPAQTPWVVSEVKTASNQSVNIKKLFKFYTISDGNAANFQVKISIQRIRPDEGLFDVAVRDFYDTDSAPVVLEKFSNLSMVEGSSNFIGLKIGTFDGGYVAKSKYITVLISDEDGIDSCVPCGFLGYPIPKYGAGQRIDVAYDTVFDDEIKPKRQYFGLNNEILDEDILPYKGISAYTNDNFDTTPSMLSNGFHLDAIISFASGGTNSGTTGNNLSGSVVYVGSESGFVFTTVDAIQPSASSTKIPRIVNEAYAEDTIYEDINLRKFTVYPYGGFDGWDVYRESRTNTDEYKSSKYVIVNGCPFVKLADSDIELDPTLNLNLPSNALNTDYYAYLAGYKQFANPNDVDINVFATPGIDFAHNLLLTEDALDVIEDQEEGRGGDSIYVVDAPMDGEFATAVDVASELDASELVSSYACTYWPWVKFYDGDAKMYINLPVTKDVVRNMAQTDNQSYPWFAPAGVDRGSVECVKAAYKTTLSDEDELYENRINPIKTFAKDGVKVWGNKTFYTKDTPLNRINVRRLMLRVKKLVTSAAKNLIFEQYDDTLEKQFKSLVEPILADVKSNRGIVDYRIMTESTPETRDQHILPARILVKPTPSLEYISISFVVYPEGVSFDESL